MQIIDANLSHLDHIARLFDLYRQFYHCQPDLALAKSFISERISKHESTIFLAEEAGEYVGFVQLYPTFCSVEATRIYVLYDLYVVESARNIGVGKQLMDRAREYAIAQGAGRIDLETAFDNYVGQHLYEKLGYKRADGRFIGYSLLL